MRKIQRYIVEDPAIPCAKCREATLGTNVIRSRLFPELAALRKHANARIHHLDHPKNRGIAELNIQGVFDYCYHLFQENAELLFGGVPEGSYSYTKCKACEAKDSRSRRSPRLISGDDRQRDLNQFGAEVYMNSCRSTSRLKT